MWNNRKSVLKMGRISYSHFLTWPVEGGRLHAAIERAELNDNIGGYNGEHATVSKCQSDVEEWSRSDTASKERAV